MNSKIPYLLGKLPSFGSHPCFSVPELANSNCNFGANEIIYMYVDGAVMLDDSIKLFIVCVTLNACTFSVFMPVVFIVGGFKVKPLALLFITLATAWTLSCVNSMVEGSICTRSNGFNWCTSSDLG